jgi:hypothetical protein
MTVALCFLVWFGATCALCWVWDLVKVPGDRQWLARGVRHGLNLHYQISRFPVEKWVGRA